MFVHHCSAPCVCHLCCWVRLGFWSVCLRFCIVASVYSHVAKPASRSVAPVMNSSVVVLFFSRVVMVCLARLCFSLVCVGWFIIVVKCFP